MDQTLLALQAGAKREAVVLQLVLLGHKRGVAGGLHCHRLDSSTLPGLHCQRQLLAAAACGIRMHDWSLYIEGLGALVMVLQHGCCHSGMCSPTKVPFYCSSCSCSSTEVYKTVLMMSGYMPRGL